MSAPRWIAYPFVPERRRLRLFCFPHAGSGAAAYRRWAQFLPAGVELALVQLPGREARLAERPFTRMRDLVAALVPALRAHLDPPFAFFGHSMGAHVAFETARALRKEGLPGPEHLLVSGNRGPSLPYPRPRIHHLSDEVILREFERLGGTPREVLAEPQLMALLLPVLRTDLELCETYAYEPGDRLECPITSFGGTRDPDVPVSALAAWRRETRGPCAIHLLEGGHFFLHETPPRFLDALARALRGPKAAQTEN